jgi:hypothetical protein
MSLHHEFTKEMVGSEAIWANTALGFMISSVSKTLNGTCSRMELGN